VSARDSQRSRVYAAEQFVRTLFDRAAQHSSRAIDFFGDPITLPPEARFGSMESVQRYIDEVLALPAVRTRWPQAGDITVRPRRALPPPITKIMTAQALSPFQSVEPPAGRCVNWSCSMRWLTI